MWVWSRMEPQWAAKFSVQVQRAFAALGLARHINSTFYVVECRHCVKRVCIACWARSRALWGSTRVVGMPGWRGQASTQSQPPNHQGCMQQQAREPRLHEAAKQFGPSQKNDAYLLWISGLTLWDEGPFRSDSETIEMRHLRGVFRKNCVNTDRLRGCA